MRRLALPFVIFPGLLPLALAGCSEGYSPNTYAATAAQQEATVQRGVIIGVRLVLISADGTVGAAAGGAAGGVAGAQASGGPVTTALGAVGGALVGGIGGAAAEQAVADAKGWEYIVQETSGSLVSVTQTSKMALPVGQHVLVIDGKQARIVPDYTVQTAAAAPDSTKTAAAPNDSTTTEIHVSPLLPAASAAAPLQAAPLTVASDPTVPSEPRPASADPTATPLAPPSTSVEAATPETVNNESSATGTLPAESTATPVQAAPGVSISTPSVSSSSAATP